MSSKISYANEKHRETIKKETKKFLDEGGEVEQIPYGKESDYQKEMPVSRYIIEKGGRFA